MFCFLFFLGLILIVDSKEGQETIFDFLKAKKMNQKYGPQVFAAFTCGSIALAILVNKWKKKV